MSVGSERLFVQHKRFIEIPLRDLSFFFFTTIIT